MGQIVIKYPNAKALRIYNALIEHFNVPRQVWDGTLTPPGMRPKTNAELKRDTDAAIRQFLRDRVFAIEERDKLEQTRTDHQEAFASNEPDIAEGLP